MSETQKAATTSYTRSDAEALLATLVVSDALAHNVIIGLAAAGYRIIGPENEEALAAEIAEALETLSTDATELESMTDIQYARIAVRALLRGETSGNEWRPPSGRNSEGI